MAIERERESDQILITCDGCHDVLISEEGLDFDEVVTDLKESGWKMKKDRDWQHFCPACSREGVHVNGVD